VTPISILRMYIFHVFLWDWAADEVLFVSLIILKTDGGGSNPNHEKLLWLVSSSRRFWPAHICSPDIVLFSKPYCWMQKLVVFLKALKHLLDKQKYSSNMKFIRGIYINGHSMKRMLLCFDNVYSNLEIES